MQTTAEPAMGLAPRLAQRQLAKWLDPVFAADAVAFRLESLVRPLAPAERDWLGRWLDWHSYAARSNARPALAARIDKLRQSLIPAESARPRPRPLDGLARSA